MYVLYCRLNCLSVRLKKEICLRASYNVHCLTDRQLQSHNQIGFWHKIAPYVAMLVTLFYQTGLESFFIHKNIKISWKIAWDPVTACP